MLLRRILEPRRSRVSTLILVLYHTPILDRMGDFHSKVVVSALPLRSQLAAQADTSIERSLAGTGMDLVATATLAVDIHKMNSSWEGNLHKSQNLCPSCDLVRGDLFHQILASHITNEFI